LIGSKGTALIVSLCDEAEAAATAEKNFRSRSAS
jgi:hypothetical protein